MNEFEVIRQSMQEGLKEALAEIRTSGKVVTPAKKRDYAKMLRENLIEGFRQDFIDAKINKQDAVLMIEEIIKAELSKL